MTSLGLQRFFPEQLEIKDIVDTAEKMIIKLYNIELTPS